MTCLILAQANPDANSFLQFWLVVGLIGNVIFTLVSIAVLFSNRKQRREINWAFEPASKEEVTQMANRIVDVENKIDGAVEGIRQERRFDNNELHKKINDVDKKVAGLETGMNFQNQTLAAVTVDIKTILGRLPRNNPI